MQITLIVNEPGSVNREATMKSIRKISSSGFLRVLNRGVLIVVSAVSGAGVPLLAQDWGGERVVNVIHEPRHRPVHVDGDLYLLDVQLNPGDESLPHVHDAAIMYTFLSNSNGPTGGRVDSNTDYVSEHYTHKIYNNGTYQTRIIAFVNFGPAISDLNADRPSGTREEPQLENEWFRSYRLELAPGEATSLQTHHNPSVVIQVSDGLTHVTRVDGITEELDAVGDWAWRATDSPFLVRNIGVVPVSVVINEGRR